MPTFQVTSPDGAVYEVNAPDGASESDAIEYIRKKHAAPQPAEPAQPQHTLGESAVRAGGLGVRDIVQGAMSLPNIVGDAANTAVNYGIRGVNKLGGNLPELGLPSQTLPRLLSQAGLPEPQTGAEHFTGAINQALTGFAPMLKGAQLASKGVQSLPFIQSMLTKPIAETAAVATGAGASEVTKQMGGGTVAQMIAGAVTPMAVSGVAGATNRVAGGINDLRRPLTQGGAEQIAGDVLGRISQDKGTSLRNLQKYNQLVESGAQVGSPGFKPTAAAVASDYGLAGGQQAIARGDASPKFAQQFAANNEAHAADLGSLFTPVRGKTADTVEKLITQYTEKRDAITGPLRKAAFDKSVAPVDYAPVASKLGEIASTAAGGRVESQKALQWIAGRLQKYEQESRTDPENAYGLYQDLGKLIAGKLKDDNNSPLILAAGLSNQIKKTLGTQIEASAPGFKNYLEHYSRLSQPLERLKIIADKLGNEGLTKVTNAATSVTDNGGSYVLSQANVKNAVQGIKSETQLAPRQRDVLGRVLGDLNAETFAARGGKQPGADTYQNIASANFINRMLGDTLGSSGLGKAIQAPLHFVNRPFESRINDLIVQAYQDPKLMEKLLRKARTTRDSPTLAGLLQNTKNTSQTGGVGLLGSLFSR